MKMPLGGSTRSVSPGTEVVADPVGGVAVDGPLDGDLVPAGVRRRGQRVAARRQAGLVAGHGDGEELSRACRRTSRPGPPAPRRRSSARRRSPRPPRHLQDEGLSSHPAPRSRARPRPPRARSRSAAAGRSRGRAARRAAAASRRNSAHAPRESASHWIEVWCSLFFFTPHLRQAVQAGHLGQPRLGVETLVLQRLVAGRGERDHQTPPAVGGLGRSPTVGVLGRLLRRGSRRPRRARTRWPCVVSTSNSKRSVISGVTSAWST